MMGPDGRGHRHDGMMGCDRIGKDKLRLGE